MLPSEVTLIKTATSLLIFSQLLMSKQDKTMEILIQSNGKHMKYITLYNVLRDELQYVN